MGLVNAVVPRDQVMKKAREWEDLPALLPTILTTDAGPLPIRDERGRSIRPSGV
jgi:hypothetical protein